MERDKPLLNPYCLLDGKVTYVDDYNKTQWKNLSPICPKCKEKLIPVIGTNKRIHHFRHDSNSECEGGYESAVHIMAKEVIAENCPIKLPPVISQYSHSGYFILDNTIKYKAVLSKAAKPIFPDKDKTIVECDMGKIKPDVLIEYKGKKLMIEILVTHAVDEEKADLIKSGRISCIEVDLSYYKGLILEKEDIRNALAGNDQNTKTNWVFNKELDMQESDIKSNTKDVLLFSSGYNFPVPSPLSSFGSFHEVYTDKVLDCPLRKVFDGNQYYSHFDTCMKCNAFLGKTKKLNNKKTNGIVCRYIEKPEVDIEDACEWLKQQASILNIPSSEDKIVNLVKTLTNRFKHFSNNTQVIMAQKEAIEIFKQRKEQKEKEINDKEFRKLYSIIYRELNNLILYGNQIFEIWQSWAYKKTKEKNLDFGQFNESEVKDKYYELAKKVWNQHCELGRKLYDTDKHFAMIIDGILQEKPLENELFKNWIYRVTKGKVLNFNILTKLINDSPRKSGEPNAISIIPYLCEIAQKKRICIDNK